MENASKAIIIVGGMLIAILVVTLLVVGWNQITDYNKKEADIQTVEQIIKFNKEFESYNKKVVYGYELISLNNLIADTNERYSPIYDGYNEIIAYITLKKNTTLVNQLSDDEQNTWTQKDKVKEKTLSMFINKVYNKAIGNGQRDFEKIFKESYFQCDEVKYDGEISGKGSGRIQELYFTQITRVE